MQVLKERKVFLLCHGPSLVQDPEITFIQCFSYRTQHLLCLFLLTDEIEQTFVFMAAYSCPSAHALHLLPKLDCGLAESTVIYS